MSLALLIVGLGDAGAQQRRPAPSPEPPNEAAPEFPAIPAELLAQMRQSPIRVPLLTLRDACIRARGADAAARQAIEADAVGRVLQARVRA